MGKVLVWQRFLLFDNNLQDKIFEEIKDKKHAYGLGYGLGYNYVLHNDNTQGYVLQIGFENEEFRKGLGQGFCNDFGSFSQDIMTKISSVYSVRYSWKSTGTRKVKYTKVSLHPRIKVRPSATHLQNRIHGFLLYEYRNLDIWMQHPIDWKVDEYENMVEFHAPKIKNSGKYKTRILVSCNHTADSLNDYLDKTIGYYKRAHVDFCLDNPSTDATL
jgi:hypothetical protein